MLRGRTASFESINRRNSGMIQRREDLRLALESRQTSGISSEGRRHDLDGDLAIQFGITRAVDLSHSARAEWGKHLIDAETRPRC